MSAFEWVDNGQRLSILVDQWRQQRVIALDTEFIRSRTFFPKIGLLQVADAQGIYLIDPLSIVDIQPLQSVLQDTQVIKVLHSCSEDLDVFQHYLSVLPTPLFDTQIAAAFAGYGASIGYANLVNTLQGDSIPKQETRSDWLQRPLSQSQLEYAALDVDALLPIYRQLVADLNKQQRLSWVETECQQLLHKYEVGEAFSQYYRRVKSAWKLQPHQLFVLQNLCAWREQQVRQLDIPRSRLIKDATLWEIAKTTPSNLKALKRIRDIHPRFIEKYGVHCLKVIQESLDNPTEYPEAIPLPLAAEQMDLFKRLKSKVVAIAEALKIPPEFLARKKDLELLVRSVQGSSMTLPQSLQGWRDEIIGQPLLDLMKEQL